MPRHPNAQSAAPPVPPLNTEEIKFWLKIMEEHAVFIRTGLPCDQSDLIEEAKSFQQEFKAFRIKAEKIQNEKKFTELTVEICRSLKEYIRYKRLLLCLSVTEKLPGGLYPSFLDHLVQEAEYFMSLLTRMRGKTLEMVKALEMEFWLRVMNDHTHFIRHLLDPAEQSIINVTEGYVKDFDALSAQARVFSSMLKRQTTEFPVFDRFLKDSRVAVTRLRDFKKALHDMIACKKLLSLISSLMADHVRREAEHFLLVLAMIEKGVVKSGKHNETSQSKYSQDCCDPEEIGGNFEGFEDLIEFEREPLQKEEKIKEYQKYQENQKREEYEEESQEMPEEFEDLEEVEELNAALFAEAETNSFASSQNVLTVSDSALTQPVSSGLSNSKHQKTAPVSQALNTPKYKMGNKWPRQLGKIGS